MDFFVFLEYASLAALRTFLQQLLSCQNFTLDSEDLLCCCKYKKWFLWTMAAAQAAENHGEKTNLWLLFMDGIQLPQGYSATMRREFTFYH